jgi:hypothetical protein
MPQPHTGTSPSRTPIIVTSAAALVLSGTVYAFAEGWTATSTAVSLAVDARPMPDGGRPEAYASGTNVIINWPQAELADGVIAQRYVVTRHGGGTSTELCVVTIPTCTESPAGPGTWSYSVRPFFEQWQGGESPQSEPVTLDEEPAPPPADVGLGPDTETS